MLVPTIVVVVLWRRAVRRAVLAERAAAEWRRAAEEDPVSGCLSRRGWETYAPPWIARGPGLLVEIDIDRFKRLNDAYGHPAGDAVLAAVGRRLRELAGTDGLVGRTGGDEFSVLMPAGDEADRGLAELRDGLSQSVDLGGERVTVTASVGVTVAAGSMEEARTEADRLMYVEKHGRRNGGAFRSPASWPSRAAG